MDRLEMYALQRQHQTLARRLELVEAILERSGIIEAVVQGPRTDPPPDDLGRLGGLAGLFGGIVPIADPAPDDVVRWIGAGRLNLAEILRRFKPGDPAPIDISRFTKVQLESAMHSIAAERARLDSLESMVKEQMSAPGPG